MIEKNQVVAVALKERFVNRSDTYGVQHKDNSYRRTDKALTEDVILQHLTGKITIGTYQLDPTNNYVKWACFDIDPERIPEPKKVAANICEHASRIFGDKAVLLEASRFPDESYHVWCFFEIPVPAYIAKYLGKRILEDCKLEKAEIELFPKQNELRKGGFGNLVKLPLGIHREHNRKSCFLEPETMKPISNEILHKIVGAPCVKEIYKIFNAIRSGKLKDKATILGDYWLNSCGFSGGKVWNLLRNWNRERSESLSKEMLVEIMRQIKASSKGYNLDQETDFQRQEIALDEKSTIYDIPCVKKVRDTSIPPSKRHDVLRKNYSILYHKITGGFQGFEDFAAALTTNQNDFDETSLDWREWVLEKPRNFNCIEVRSYLENVTQEFSCKNCPLTVDTYDLHPARGLNEVFVYDPIGQLEYVYKTTNGKKGICKAKKKDDKWCLSIEGQNFFFKREPLDRCFFHLPKRDIIQKWVDGEIESKSLKSLWKQTILCLRTFLDLPNEHDFSALAMFVVQSWLSEMLETVFYCAIKGEYGGGKTVCGETTIQMCRHGFQAGNLTAAFIARAIDEQKLTLFADEIDSTTGNEDSELYQILRQGYRRGTFFSRVKPKTMKTETFQVFGPKIFSLHSSLEPALQSRTLPIHVRETENVHYPVIGSVRTKYAQAIGDKLFLWYIDNAYELWSKQISKVDEVDTVYLLGDSASQEIEMENIPDYANRVREELFRQTSIHLSKSQLSQLSQLKGRNVELAQILMIISNLVDVDLTDEIAEIFELKTAEEDESLEIGRMGVLKDVLTNLYHEKSGDSRYLTKEGFIKVSNKEIYGNYTAELIEQKIPIRGTHSFNGFLIEFGFQNTVNRKKLKVPILGGEASQSRLCCIYTPNVLKKLGIDTDSPSEKSDSGDELVAVIQ